MASKRALAFSPSTPCTSTPTKVARPSDEADAFEDSEGEGALVIDLSPCSTSTAPEQPDDEAPDQLQQEEEGGPWTEVNRSRRKARDTARDAPLPRFKVKLEGHSNGYQAVTALEADHRDLKLTVRPNLKGEYILTPRDAVTVERLKALSREGDPNSRVTLLDPEKKQVKGVLQRYPLDLPLEAVKAHPAVLSAERLRAWGDKAPTRQVVVVHEGRLPEKLDLGAWGKYTLRPYDKEPVRCYKCHRFSHFQTRCAHSVRWVCSQSHPTEDCIARHKARETTSARCPNCSGRHHAWNPRCPERLRRLPAGGKRGRGSEGPQGAPSGRVTFVPAPPPTRPAWLPPDANPPLVEGRVVKPSPTGASPHAVPHPVAEQRRRRRRRRRRGRKSKPSAPTPASSTGHTPSAMPAPAPAPLPAPQPCPPPTPTAQAAPEATPCSPPATSTNIPARSEQQATAASTSLGMLADPLNMMKDMLLPIVRVLRRLLEKPDAMPADDGSLGALLMTELARAALGNGSTPTPPAQDPKQTPPTHHNGAAC